MPMHALLLSLALTGIPHRHTPENHATEIYLYSSNSLAMIYNGTQAKSRMVVSDKGRVSEDDVASGNQQFMIRDHADTVVCTVTAETVTHDVLRDPYGFVLLREGAEAAFAGYSSQHREAVSSWVDFGARFYDPAIARFMSVDPKASANPLWSPYNFTNGNPVTLQDPDGQLPILAPMLVGAATEIGMQVGMNMLSGQSFGEAIGNISWGGVAFAGATGGLPVGKVVAGASRWFRRSRVIPYIGRISGRASASNRRHLSRLSRTGLSSVLVRQYGRVSYAVSTLTDKVWYITSYIARNSTASRSQRFNDAWAIDTVEAARAELTSAADQVAEFRQALWRFVSTYEDISWDDFFSDPERVIVIISRIPDHERPIASKAFQLVSRANEALHSLPCSLKEKSTML